MNDSSPEPSDPWAPPERPAVELGKPQGTPGTQDTNGTPGVSGPPSVHDQQTLAGMPGDQLPPTAPTPTPTPAPAAPPAGPASAAYGYPVQQPGYGYPGDAGYPGPAGYQGYPGPQGYPGGPQGYPGGPQGYPGHGSYAPYGPQPSNGFGIAALVLGIISVLGCFLSFAGVAIGIAAVVFGALGKGKANRGEADNGGMALAGIILGAVGILLGVLILLAAFASLMDLGPIDDSPYDSPYDNSQVHEKV
ncbi:DUF4190 domain-containing protein [Streptomyces sp. NPDC001581]|uniref:DUF4190 domain-containing protein n=1 Tax=Streptomyces sp. NPDC001581 TaxID=3154386 RepID=UPI00332F80E2